MLTPEWKDIRKEMEKIRLSCKENVTDVSRDVICLLDFQEMLVIKSLAMFSF